MLKLISIILALSISSFAVDINKKIIPIQKIYLKQPSTFKETPDVYKNYIKYLIKNGTSQEEIKKMIAESENTITNNMLLGIFYDYEVNQPNKASHYYVNILNKGREYIRGSINAVYISDYMLREKNYKIILDILPKNSCELFSEDFKYKCFYYQAVSNYNLDFSYDIELEKAKQKEPKAMEFFNALQEIKKEGIKK
jgi:hypothetical protein